MQSAIFIFNLPERSEDYLENKPESRGKLAREIKKVKSFRVGVEMKVPRRVEESR